ncbi:N-6 DNA methylase [Crocosphaera sp.]|uniref:N-6 DNA methylase n=1 Tax=Crocosphaera sp. TaxID=2729996 RepID=UPI0026326B66|nr:N-6 DNA methylase [Crocosphaera sp.]MDJ0583229.1 N-6 DNA methylase [Crocosphaera sp.]
MNQQNYSTQLCLPLNYKDTLQQIRNYLAGQFIGATRDEVLLEEVIKCMLCKLYIKEHNKKLHTLDIPKEYKKTFHYLRSILPNIFDSEDEFKLDSSNLIYLDQTLENLDINNLSRDPFGDAYEIFCGSLSKGQHGQFFTPQNAVELLVSIVNPQPGETIIDPACGAGSFLNAAARHLIGYGIKQEQVKNYLFGIDKDEYLVRLASARLSLISLDLSNVFCTDSLAWNFNNPLEKKLGTFDVVLANPPFGSKIIAANEETKAGFILGYKWHFDKSKNRFTKFNTLQSSVPPQVLFIERCISLVKPGGRIGIVIPESLISSKSYRYVMNYIQEKAEIKAVIGMPESLFKVSGKGGTHTKTCLLLMYKKFKNQLNKNKHKIFMAEAKWCGNDSRGRQINQDDLPKISTKYQKYIDNQLNEDTLLGYIIDSDEVKNYVFSPRYYNPEVKNELFKLQETHDLIKLGDMIDSGLIQVKTGDEVGKLAYGTGIIPFVRTTDISNWEIKRDPKHCISEDIYNSLSYKQDVKENDILMVKDGSYLIGTCGFITKYDTKIIYQSHIYKLRVMDTSKLSPYFLLVALTSEPVRKQIKAKCFTQDIIDSLGDRIRELVLPVPKNKNVLGRVIEMVKKSIEERIEARELARKACIDLVAKN